MKPAVLADRTAEGLHAIERYLETRWDIDLFRPVVEWLWLEINLNRKDAATVNREFFDWLSRRNRPDRPFFAFLNLCDAHWPYQLP
jgi:membrane-anchored protein YejM (alkaline phosphatase superfamily)